MPKFAKCSYFKTGSEQTQKPPHTFARTAMCERKGVGLSRGLPWLWCKTVSLATERTGMCLGKEKKKWRLLPEGDASEMPPVHFRSVLNCVVVAERANNVAAMWLTCSLGTSCVGYWHAGIEGLLGE